MNKNSTVFSFKENKKNRIALYIRVFALIAVTLFYVISSAFISDNKNDVNIVQGESYSGRKILGFNESAGNVSSINATTTEPSNSTYEKSPEEKCVRAAILELPSDGFTRAQRKNGWIAIHVFLACYCFWFLATICDDYFVPAIEVMCNSFNMDEDVVGATFMAAATSSPELFINSVGTFITKSDIGVGTVVGSAVFNVLAVPACCGLFAGQLIHLDWWPVSRDCLMYAISVVSLIGVLQDGTVMWYEALILVLAYFMYISVMYWNDIMARKARTMVAKLRRQSRVRLYRERTEITPLLAASDKRNSADLSNCKDYRKASATSVAFNGTSIRVENHLQPFEENISDFADSPWSISPDTSVAAFIFKWPIIFVLWFTLPDCRKHPRLKMLTFSLCIVWIGITSYAVAMFITIIGDTMNIPDSVMGLTFLAAGTSVPEAVSSVIVTNQGHGAMGISSSISSNTFDILLCLGLPWFIKAYFYPEVEGIYSITFNSTGLNYSAISLLSTLCALYIAFALNKFRLDWKIGLTCTLMYVAFLVFASLVELNVFFPVNLPICDH